MIFYCKGFDGAFTDKAVNAFKPGSTMNLPKAGGGTFGATVVDMTGDGVADGLDLNGDGIPEILFLVLVVGERSGLDLNGDGVIDYYLAIKLNGEVSINASGYGSGASVSVTTNSTGQPTGFNTTGSTSVDNNILSQIYADATIPTASANNAGGTFTSAQTVRVSCADNISCNAVAYTLDGSAPNFSGNGKVVAGNAADITINQTSTLRYVVRDAKGNISITGGPVNFTIGSNTAGTTWTGRTMPGPLPNIYTDVTYGNGIFVSVGGTTSNLGATSSDGVTWTSRTLPNSTDWFSVAYGNGLFLAMSGNSNNISATSPDGINWTSRTLPASSSWRSIYGGSTWVAIRDNSNQAYTSSDAIAWTARTLPTTSFWRAITYGGGRFVTVAEGPSTAAATSTDGISWSTGTLPSSQNWWAVAYGNGVFVAIATNSNSAATSTDGVNWNARTLPSTRNWYDIEFGNGLFVIVNFDTTDALTSPDGINWTAKTMPGAGYRSLTYGGNTFVAVGTPSMAATSP